jgi:hypothetical protein
MAKPTSKPDWTDGNPSFGTVTIEPSAGKKLNGWSAAERPPFQTMNWLFYNIGVEWLNYFESITDSLSNLQGVFDAVVGTGGDFATLTDLVLDADWIAGNIKNVLVTSDQTISAPVTIDQNDVNIEFKPGVNVLKGIGANRALIIDAERVRVTKGRFANFSDPGDYGIEVAASASHVMIMENFFFNNDNAILDSGGTNVLLSNNIEE